MKIFDQLERKRAWETEEQAILDAMRRVADQMHRQLIGRSFVGK